MSAVIRKFVTTWSDWAVRFTDHRMAPYCAPFFVADCGKAGFLVGPYLSEQGEIRDELVKYADFEAAHHEIKLEPTDLLAASVWTRELAPLGDIAKTLEGQLGLALKTLTTPAKGGGATPADRRRIEDERLAEYLARAVYIVKLALEAYRAYHQGDEARPIPEPIVLPRRAAGLSDLFKARLADRDQAVSSAATSRLLDLARRRRRANPVEGI